jgi:hypothetical protein
VFEEREEEDALLVDLMVAVWCAKTWCAEMFEARMSKSTMAESEFCYNEQKSKANWIV